MPGTLRIPSAAVPFELIESDEASATSLLSLLLSSLSGDAEEPRHRFCSLGGAPGGGAPLSLSSNPPDDW